MMHSTPLGYANTLGYISDPSTIRRRVLDWFDRAPSVEKCATIRAKYLADHAPSRNVDMVDLGKLGWRCDHEKTADNISVKQCGRQVCSTCLKARWREQKVRRAERDNERTREAQRATLVNAGFNCDFETGDKISAIVGNAAMAFAVLPADIRGNSRRPENSRPRFAACLTAYEMGHSTPAIAKYVGGRDHTTILNSIKRAKDIAAREPEYAAALDALLAAALA